MKIAIYSWSISRLTRPVDFERAGVLRLEGEGSDSGRAGTLRWTGDNTHPLPGDLNRHFWAILRPHAGVLMSRRRDFLILNECLVVLVNLKDIRGIDAADAVTTTQRSINPHPHVLLLECRMELLGKEI
ncbi:hypothetical protein [Streptomyces chartreusis]